MSDNVIGITQPKGKRLCMADERYLEWYEMFNALPHMHVHKLFAAYWQKQQRYIKQVGRSDISVAEVMQCFIDAATEMANVQAGSKYQSVMAQIESDFE